MDKALSYLIAIILDIAIGSAPFLGLSFYQIIAIILLGTAIYSFLISDLSIFIPISLVPFTLISHSYSFLLVSSVSTVLSYYLKEKATAFLLTLGVFLVTFDLEAVYQLLAFLILVAVLIYLKVDLLGIVANGIFLLIISAVIAANQGLNSSLVNIFSDGAYYSLAFGVLGIVFQDIRLPRKVPRVPLLYLPYALITLGFGIPFKYYWWNPSSFLFKADPLSLWVPITYFPQVNQILGSWPLAHLLIHLPIGVDLYIALLTYLSGIGSYLMFKKQGIRQASLFSLVYQLLSPFPHPYLLLGYAILPFTAYLMSINMRSAVKYPAVMLMSVIGSSFFLFPVSAILIGAFLKRKDLPWIGVAMVGANAFWIIPYIILGAPASGEIPSYLSLALLLPILVMTVKVEDRVKVLISLGSIAYLVSGLPYSELAYPVAIASTLIVISGVGIKRILAGVVITLLLITSVLQFANYHGVSIPSNVQEIDKKVDNATLIWWNYSYPLLSPVPTNTTQIISQAIQYIVNNQGNVIPNPNYTGFPASFKVIFPRNLTRVNGTWISETYAQYTLNSSFFHIDYKSPNITVNTSYGIVIKSLLGEQFVAWKIPEAENRSTLLVGLTGSWISYSGEPMLFLGYNVSNYSSLAPINFTALTLWLTKAGQIFLYSNHGLRILPRACPIPTSGSFNINFYFIDQGNFTILAGEQINGKFHSLYINTTLPWYEVNAVGLILPIGDELNLTQIQFPQFVPTNVTQNWISWDSPVPFKISFYPNKPLNGTIYLASKRPVFMEVNGIPASNGSTFLNASNITLISGPGFVNVTSIYFIHNGTREYIVGAYPINLTYLVKINPLLGGEKIVVQSHISLNMTVIPLGLVYKLDGIPLNVSDTAVLRPGTHVLEILYPGQAYLIIGLYFTFLSFVIAMLSEILKNSLTQIRTFINKILYKVEKNEG